MRYLQLFLRPAGLAILLMMVTVAALGLYSIRKDIENLRVFSQDNILWAATQMEIELLRFQRSLAVYVTDPTEEALDNVHERFDILWSRLDLVARGRVGERLRQLDEGYGTLGKLQAYVHEIDPLIVGLEAGSTAGIPQLLRELEALQSELRFYTLRVVRSDTAAASQVRERMRTSAQLTASIGLSALAICLLALVLVLRDNARQREMAAMNQRQAEAAAAASRAKSRFLTMMSHELRNPLNGILGPLALLGQSDLGERQVRLVERAQQAGRTMLRMLSGLLEFGDIEDGRLVLKEEAIRLRGLADEIDAALRDVATEVGGEIGVELAPTTPELVMGDHDRLAQIFIYLGQHLLQPGGRLRVRLGHDGRNLVGDVVIEDADESVDWRLGLLMGMQRFEQPFSADALGPLIARGLLAAAHGVLNLAEAEDGARIVRVVVPARPIVFDKIRLHLETCSGALETLYRVALRSERVEFLPRDSVVPADVVLVDSTSVGEPDRMAELRARFPEALFVSLGLPSAPGYFDEIVEAPHDMAQLRARVLGRLRA